MRKLIFAISVMALPLAACGLTEDAPKDPEQTPPTVEEPVTGSDDAPSATDGTDTDGTDADGSDTDSSAMKPGMDEPQAEPTVPAGDDDASGEKSAE